VLDSNRLSVC